MYWPTFELFILFKEMVFGEKIIQYVDLAVKDYFTFDLTQEYFTLF